MQCELPVPLAVSDSAECLEEPEKGYAERALREERIDVRRGPVIIELVMYYRLTAAFHHPVDLTLRGRCTRADICRLV